MNFKGNTGLPGTGQIRVINIFFLKYVDKC